MKFFHEYHNAPHIIHNNTIFWEPHLHNAVEIIALYHGHTTLTVDGTDYELNDGDFLLVFPNTVHSYDSKDTVDVGKFIFSPQVVPELQGIFAGRRPKSPVILKDRAESAHLHDLSLEILESFKTSSSTVKKAYLLLLTGKLLELCELEENQRSDRDIVNQIFDYCQQNFRQKITQKDAAHALHISESHLSHLFMYRIKINFCSYINILRVNEACSLLQQSDKSIIEIAEESGFSSLRTFNRAFLRHVGISPREYRHAP